MRRFAVPLVIAGTATVLVALVMLWRSIMTESEAAAPSATETVAERPSAPATAPAFTAPQAPALPTARAPERATERRDNAPQMPTQAPRLDDEPAPGTSANKKNLEMGITQMRALVAANEPLVRECVTQAAARGDAPSGDATLTFIVAKKGDAYVIEDTAVDHDQTTIKSDPLLDCLHGTSKALKFAGLPREAAAVFVTRTVKVDSGQLVENKLIKFSYLR